MNVSIVDSNYTQEGHFGMAASWLKYKAEQFDNVKVVDVNFCDYVLMTVSSQQGVSRVRSEVRKIKKTNKSAKIILGGGGCYAPAIFQDHVDVICVGEGDVFIETLFQFGFDAAIALDNVWIKGESRKVIPDNYFNFSIPPILNPDGTYRLFASRGCRFKCLFCQTGLERNFITAPPDVVDANKRNASSIISRGGKIAFITNDGADKDVALFGKQEFISVTLRNLKKIMPLNKSSVKGVRIGVEGVSERLRVAVGKKVDNVELVDVSAELLANGIGVRWFFIPGLPYETDEDWDNMRELVLLLKRKIKKGVVMMNFHSFIPMPATPLSIFPLVDEYWERYDEFRRWFFDGVGFTRRVQLVNPNQYKSRLRRAMESMAATEDELRRGWWEHNNVNWRVEYLNSPERLRIMASGYAARLKAD